MWSALGLTPLSTAVGVPSRSLNVYAKYRQGNSRRKKVGRVDEKKQLRLQAPRWWRPPPPQPQAPLGQTHHPVNRFEAREAEWLTQVQRASAPDRPTTLAQDPYAVEPRRCILCPRRYAEAIQPSYKNPKLLAQFVSPHTGRVYESHITGLCAFMQQSVEREAKIAQKFGLLGTKMKEVHYLKDPALFNPVRSVKPNPF
eukprot:maker-scaffold41_size498431-snap-gene-1.15 protein:Tk00190 transcript:maker-scaffold41_size498431-snap-gene-1.15-mRNA-1 annotation:"28s ribosomal protein mitochondrial precursor"